MSRRHTNLGGGPPRGPGHYSQDGRRWWDDRHQRWFPVTDQEDQLEIEVEDLGATSLPARLWTTLVTQYGTRYYRFVGQARSADRRWPTYRVTGASFPATGLEDPSGKGAWASEQRGRLEELHQQLENYVLSPRISQKTMKLNAGVAFAAAMAGGAVGGFIGAFFALPIAAIIQAFLATYSRQYDIIESDLTHVDKPKLPTTRPVQE